MKLSDFDYNLPSELIAQEPIKPRDHSRLLVLDRKTIVHKHFYDIIDYLEKGDLLVLNNTKVFPARLIGKKAETGGKIEVFLLKKSPQPPLSRGSNNEVWECLIGGKGARAGLEILIGKKIKGKILQNNNDNTSTDLNINTWLVEFNLSGKKFMNEIEKEGLVPLPPYIKRDPSTSLRYAQDDKKLYQTIFADEGKTGSVAAPTAGLHFTKELLKKIKAKGVQIEYVTLHVGLGTFAPVKVEKITEHKMHSEWAEVKTTVIKKIIKTKQGGKRVITVGTTTTRTLESLFQDLRIKNKDLRNFLKIKNYNSWVNIFIYPGYKFRVVDGIITNFHLPKSTLLMLVSAFSGLGNIRKAYREAIKKGYRFYSYGDAMFIKK